jgi:hypothetical protein
VGWKFVGVSSQVQVTTTGHTLVTTGISGLQAGDLLIACITSRIASTTSITLPSGGEWTLIGEQKANNVLTTTSAVASGMMAYCIRGASNPNFTFTHPVAPSVARGVIVAYRWETTSAKTPVKDTQSAATTAVNTTAVSTAGFTTANPMSLIIKMCAGGQEAADRRSDCRHLAGAYRRFHHDGRRHFVGCCRRSSRHCWRDRQPHCDGIAWRGACADWRRVLRH